VFPLCVLLVKHPRLASEAALSRKLLDRVHHRANGQGGSWVGVDELPGRPTRRPCKR
jgi:hypothetical protein